MSRPNDLLKNVYRIFSPWPLTQDDVRLYVDLEAVRGETGFVESLANKIELEGQPTCQLLTGHLGSGKSTELGQLKGRLEHTTPKPFVLVCDILKDFNPTEIDFPEVLLLVMRQLAIELEKREQISLEPGFVERRWSWLKQHLFSEVEFEGLKLGQGLVELTGKLQHSPDTRKEFRKSIDPHTDTLIESANETIGVAKQRLRGKGYQDMVLLVDGLDKMTRDTHPQAECTVGEHLYIHRNKEMASLLCHVVYTIPLYLAYSSSAHTISSLYGITDIPVVPVAKVRNRPPSKEPFARGVKRFRDVVRRRLGDIKAKPDDVFAGDTMDQLIAASGGQLRELMIMVREAAAARLPIDDHAVERTLRGYRRTYARWLEKKHWPVIEEAAASGSIERCAENAQIIEQLLDSRAILHYRNDGEWYGPNPVLPEPPKT